MALSINSRMRSNRRPRTQRNFAIAAGVRIFEGALVVVASDGYARPARTATGDLFVGRCIYERDNTGGGNGGIAEGVEVECDLAILCKNSAGGDAIAITDIGKECFLVDDETVALTNGTNTRSSGGRIWAVTAEGVWIVPAI